MIAVRSRDGALDQLGVAGGVADTHVHDDLDEAGDLHDVGVAELLVQRRRDLVAVARLEARLDLGASQCCRGGHHQMSLPVRLAIADALGAVVVDACGSRRGSASCRRARRRMHVGDVDRRLVR